MSDKIEDAFKRNTHVTRGVGGRYMIRCNKGLWAVDAPSYEVAMREATHYFAQYYADGEYDA